MKIILRADVENLGHLGDVVEVKPGYGRNYLIPQDLAMLATPANLRAFELERKKLQARMDEIRAVASTVANDGIMMQPMLVKEILDSKGKSLKKIEPKQLGEVTSKENASTMKDLMRGVVTDGTGGNAAVSGIEVSGKTGTADHKADASAQRGAHSWFTGFAPYDNPEIVISVIVEEGGVGGKKAAQVTRDLIESYLK